MMMGPNRDIKTKIRRGETPESVGIMVQVNSDGASEFICTKMFTRYGVLKIMNMACAPLIKLKRTQSGGNSPYFQGNVSYLRLNSTGTLPLGLVRVSFFTRGSLGSIESRSRPAGRIINQRNTKLHNIVTVGGVEEPYRAQS